MYNYYIQIILTHNTAIRVHENQTLFFFGKIRRKRVLWAGQ